MPDISVSTSFFHGAVDLVDIRGNLMFIRWSNYVAFWMKTHEGVKKWLIRLYCLIFTLFHTLFTIFHPFFTLFSHFFGFYSVDCSHWEISHILGVIHLSRWSYKRVRNSYFLVFWRCLVLARNVFRNWRLLCAFRYVFYRKGSVRGNIAFEHQVRFKRLTEC